MKTTLKALGIIGLCCCAAACSKTNDVGSKYVKSQTVSALNGGSVAVTSADDARLAGTVIQIPPSALAADTTITIAEGADLSTAQGVTVGPVVEFGPDQLKFQIPSTITVPFQLGTGQTIDQLMVVGVESNGTVIVVDNGSLTIDNPASTVSFTAAGFTRFAAVAGQAVACPPNETLCGCCGSGVCIPSGQACPIACPANACGFDGGGHGNSCCPAGEYFCGCGGHGQCIPDNQACPLACPEQGAPNIPAICCQPGTYFCGCDGVGVCVPDNVMCADHCGGTDGGVCQPDPAGNPVTNCCLPDASGSPVKLCCPPGSTDLTLCTCTPSTAICGGNCPPGTIDSPCGCIPPTALCVPPPQDGGIVCPAGSVNTACGCIPPTATCVPPDAGIGCGAGSYRCCDGQCVPMGALCPAVCAGDGGNTCPTPSTLCCDGQCVPLGGICPQICPQQCPTGENLCCGKCQPAGVACPGVCPPPTCQSGETMCCGRCQPSGLNCPAQCPGTCPQAGENYCCGQCQPAGVPCPTTCSGGADAGP